MNLGRSNKDKYLSIDYVHHINNFFEQFWTVDFNNLKDDMFFSQLKPKLQNELSDLCFQWVYDKFSGFFWDIENGAKRDIAHNLVFQDFRLFKPYTETYKDDKRSFPDRQKNVLLKK